ncbi:MAG: (2Fe-2S)-binding protein [Clostridiaceae bacterium]|nr:(2Fe-2S)-binding protein [Clostridiaceae bacterium]
MAGNRVICSQNNIDYITIRKAMVQGARTQAEVAKRAGVCTVCAGCRAKLDQILSSVCGCRKIPLKAVVNAVQMGADTVGKVGALTGAGTGVDEVSGEACGKCKGLIQNIIDLGR